ncbi:hypothetical protein [Streptococcus sanguinis]|uniref:hypothetical protein n=1 Tax=Streptococcus sanguinis TaxID=1305 RepID=UPI000F0EE602|nr:hypothetical protein [Streptococcus sanguinis]MCC3167102.1 hypothetical protein [Streptococcus sanguinis]RKW06044.1 MAG: hypothetical protein D8H99_05490 [Streptococcus sp.]
MSTYKSELFNLCKSIEQSELSKKVKEMWNNFKTDDSLYLNKTIWFTSTRDNQNHFYGVLLSQSRPENTPNSFSNCPKLDQRELEICKEANEFLVNLSTSLTNELSFLPTSIRTVLNPYSKLLDIDTDFYEKINISNQEEIDFSRLLKKFRKSHIFNVIESKTQAIDPNLLDTIQKDHLLEIFAIFEKNEVSCSYDEIPKNLNTIKTNEINGRLRYEDVVEFFFFSLYVIRDVIEITLNTLYSALQGQKLPILSNDNLISINGPSTNYLYKKYELVKISSEHDDNHPSVSNLCLIDAYLDKEKQKVHSLIYIVTTTYRHTGRFGSTTSMKGLEVDDCLNRFFSFFKNKS